MDELPDGNPIQRMVTRGRWEYADSGFRLYARSPTSLNARSWELIWNYKQVDMPGSVVAVLDALFTLPHPTPGGEIKG